MQTGAEAGTVAGFSMLYSTHRSLHFEDAQVQLQTGVPGHLSNGLQGFPSEWTQG